MKKLRLLTYFVSTTAFCSDGFEVLSKVGAIYERTEGSCAMYMDNMKWGVGSSIELGTISLANTNRPIMRPLEGYVRSVTISAKNLLPIGQGVFVYEFNQPTPVKAEFEYEGDDKVTIYVLNKGKGSMGGIFGDNAPVGFAGTHQTFKFEFSNKNDKGVFQDLTTTYRNMKGLRMRKSEVCKFKLEE